MKAVEYRQKRAELVTKARAIQNTADEQKRDMSPEEAESFKSVMVEVESLKKKCADGKGWKAGEPRVAAVKTRRTPASARPARPPPPPRHAYSMLRGIRAMLSGKPLDGLEREVSDEI